jgi:hypothetical protein
MLWCRVMNWADPTIIKTLIVAVASVVVALIGKRAVAKAPPEAQTEQKSALRFGPELKIFIFVVSPSKPNFAQVWARLLAQADRPFLTDGGHEFSYQVEGEALRLSHRDALLAREMLERAWAAMPCPAVNLPAECKPKGYVWTLLHDTRIAGTGLLPEVPPALAEAAKKEEKSAAQLRPKPRKRRSSRAVAQAKKRAEARRNLG